MNHSSDLYHLWMCIYYSTVNIERSLVLQDIYSQNMVLAAPYEL
jgi:hypothetical protein